MTNWHKRPFRSVGDKTMKNTNRIFAAAFLVAFLACTAFAQQQGAQTLSTTTLGSAITTTYGTNVNLASLTNVVASVNTQTVLWVDTEAMAVVTGGVPSSGTTVTVTRGAYGTKATTHASGRTVYVGRPNLFHSYDVSGSCTAGSGLAAVLPWINLTSGRRYNCKSGGSWFVEGKGSATSESVTSISRFCTGTVGTGQTDFLNMAACSGATTATATYVVVTPGELANLRVFSSANETQAAGDVLTLNKNGSATALTCTILQNGATCSDTTHSVAVVAGDTITFSNVAPSSGAAANLSATVGLYGQ